jgi:hypothetical protein
MVCGSIECGVHVRVVRISVGLGGLGKARELGGSSEEEEGWVSREGGHWGRGSVFIRGGAALPLFLLLSPGNVPLVASPHALSFPFFPPKLQQPPLLGVLVQKH